MKLKNLLKNKRGEMGVVGIILIVVIAIMVLRSGVLGTFTATPSGTTGTTTTTTTTSGNILAGLDCATKLGGNTQTLAIAPVDLINPGSPVTETTVLKYDGQDIGTVTADQTLQPGKSYEFITNGTDFYYTYATGTLPCESRTTLTPQLARMGSLEINSLNSDGVTVNPGSASSASSTNQSIGSGETVIMTLKLKANESDAYWSNPQAGKYLIAIDINTTDFDTGVGTTEIMNSVRTSVPQKNAGTYEIAYDVIGIPKDYNTESPLIKIVSKSNKNPIASGCLSNPGVGSVRISVQDYDYFKHTVTGSISNFGVEDNLGVDLGISDQLGYICYQ